MLVCNNWTPHLLQRDSEDNMPVSIKRSPFSNTAATESTAITTTDPTLVLRTPQARVLAVLMPDDLTDPPSRWPLVTRAQLGVRAGYTAISGTVTRALNGICTGSSSGDSHPGLLERGMIDSVTLDIEGVKEVNYLATALGVQAYQAYLATQGAPPQLRDAATCTNHRYKKDGGQRDG